VTAARRVLVAEDDAALRGIMEGLLVDAGLEVVTAEDGEAALEAFAAAHGGAGAPFDAVLADINMPRRDGLALIDALRALDPTLPVVFVTAYSSVDSAVTALRKGAHDYITKPFRNDQLVRAVGNAVEQRRLRAENRTLRQAVERTYGVSGVVGRSPGLQAVFRVVERAGPTSASILIRGETGTGKELVARAIHLASPRADGPFLTVNCAALPVDLLESELFGHEKGAFTGAVARSLGLFRAAQGGTLFLDEVGEMSAALQAKLLRALEAREVRPVGATATIPVDVRIVGATHRDLLAGVEADTFREDLYYRLAVIELEVPPLRARTEDVAPLVRHFLERIARERGEATRAVSPACLERLERYPWPGNVRELLNAMEHAAALGGETLEVADLPTRVRRHTEGATPAPSAAALPAGGAVPTLAELERTHVLAVLEQAAGDRRRASELLGIDQSTLYRKLKRWTQG